MFFGFVLVHFGVRPSLGALRDRRGDPAERGTVADVFFLIILVRFGVHFGMLFGSILAPFSGLIFDCFFGPPRVRSGVGLGSLSGFF